MKRRGLTRNAVLDAALALADAEGLEALTMRRLATALGVEAMSLYNHVASREDLCTAIADLAWAGVGRTDPHLSARAAIEAHPWVLELPSAKPGPHRLAARAALKATGEPNAEALIIGRAWIARSLEGIAMLISQTISTPDGPFTLIEDTGVVVGAGWTDSVTEVATRAGIVPDAVVTGACLAANAVLAFYDGDTEAVAQVAVAPHGTEFRERVWEVLRNIPAGETRTYGEVAAQLGNASASRAVGAACGANVTGLFVPCHRVVGSSGSLTGFAWGVETKKALLQREGVLARV
jgi:O-6-methylguanine DNA methyltransferase